MKREIKITVDPQSSENKKGDFFESLLRSVFETQRYEVTERVNFTAMEIDLMAKHRDRAEIAYIECKARERLESDDIKVFVFNTRFRQANHGYFLSTSEFQHQVAGLIEEMHKKPEYSNLYFWGPAKILELLESAGTIGILDTTNVQPTPTKMILSYTHFGTFYVLILTNGTIPTQFTVFEAKRVSAMKNAEIARRLQEAIPEIRDLEFLPVASEAQKAVQTESAETVAEVQESEQWYDYLPASTRHFVGRTDLRASLFAFLNQVASKTTARRVFYIEGKSGWGKSSLITDLRGRARNRYYRKRYFVLAVDARSASTSNFVALAFKKLIESATKSNFLASNLFVQKLNIVSSFDVLSSRSVSEFVTQLERENKVLVLVFDQFEDVFARPGLFRAFHKFLLDIDQFKSNLVLGFSWKSEINIPIDHEAYHLWQQAKNFALCISMREFNSSEINGVVKQLNKTIDKPIGLDLKRRLIESSQGFPWLIKKLCIHTYKQINAGKTVENLVEEDLNCEALFRDDLEGLSPQETKALKYIAKRSSESNFLDATEVGEKVEERVTKELVNKRLVVKSGTKYNVYWDIFRDYLVTGEVPPIGESYILRQYVKVCIDVFELFKGRHKSSLEELQKLHPRSPTTGTLGNILRELRSVGLVRKVGDFFEVNDPSKPATPDTAKKHIREKLKRYTPYLRIEKLKTTIIGLPEIVDVLKGVFRGTSFSQKTWITYANYLISWFRFADMELLNRLSPPFRTPHGSLAVDTGQTFTPQQRPQKDVKVFRTLRDGAEPRDFKRLYHSLYDLKSLGLITYARRTVFLTEQAQSLLKHLDTCDFEKSIAIRAVCTRKIREAAKCFFEDPGCSRKDLSTRLSTLTSNLRAGSYKKQTNNILFAWGRFVSSRLSKEEFDSLSKPSDDSQHH